MVVLELLAQGIRGFPPASRIAFKPGYNVVVPPAGALPELGALFLGLCFADGRGSDAGLAEPGARAARAGFTLLGRDGKTYRLLREIGGTGALHCLDPSGKFQPVTQDAGEMAQYLRSQLGLPSRRQVEELLVFRKERFPSRRSAVGASSPAGPVEAAPQATRRLAVNPLIAAAEAAQPKASGDPEVLRARLTTLQSERAAVTQIEELQFSLDGLNQQLFQIDEKLKELQALRMQVAAAQAGTGGPPNLEKLGIPRDIARRAEEYGGLQKRRDDTLARLQAERDALEQRQRFAPASLHKDQQFLGAAGAGVALLVIGALLSGAARYVALLAPVAFGWAALLALKYIGDLQGKESFGRRMRSIEERAEQARRQFENDVAVVRAAMTAMGADGPRELMEAIGKVATDGTKLKQAEEQLQAKERDGGYIRAQQERPQLAQQVAEIEARLETLGSGYSRSRHEIEAEIAQLEGALSGAQPAFSAAAPGPRVSSAGPALQADPVPELLSLASDLLSTDVATLGGALKARASQYLQALSDRRFGQIELDLQGLCTVLASGQQLPAAHIPAADLDLVYLAVRLALVEQLAKASKVPIFLDEPFAGQPDAKLTLLSRMLKHIGTFTQVVHLTALPAHRAVADAALSLGGA